MGMWRNAATASAKEDSMRSNWRNVANGTWLCRFLVVAMAWTMLVVAGAEGQETFVCSTGTGELLLVDLSTGDRTVVSSGTVGSGANTTVMSVIQESSGTLLVGGDADPMILRVDPSTGDGPSSQAIGSAPVMYSAACTASPSRRMARS